MKRTSGSFVLSSLRLSIRYSLAVLLSVCFAAASFAQQYQVDEADVRARVLVGAAQACVKNPATWAQSKDRFEEYFAKYYFPTMTNCDPESLEDLGSSRRDLFRRYLWATDNAELQTVLTDIALPAAAKMAGGQYHPAVRYNGVLILGQLDKQYGIDTGPNRRPPQPHPVANNYLVKIADAAIDPTKNVPPQLVVGALVGLERHAQYRDSLSAQQVEAMTAVLLSIATSSEPLSGMDRRVHAWVQMQAAEALAQLGTVGTDNKNLDALLMLVADARYLDDRCDAAGLLSKLNYDGATIDGQAGSDRLLGLAKEVGTSEAKRATDFQESSLAGGGFVPSGGFGGRGSGRSIGYGESNEYDRGPLLARLISLRAGLAALQPLVPADAQPKFSEIIAAIDIAKNTAADKKEVDLDVVDKVIDMNNVIQRTAGAGPAEDAEADDFS